VPLLFLESIGTTELLIILLVALVVFGPRRLPSLARSLGKSLDEFKRASDDLKRTWEREAAMEGSVREVAVERATVAELLPMPTAPTAELDAESAALQGTSDTPPQSAAIESGSHVETSPALAATI
jgi:sec-independent protein translocase protein TatB